MYKEESEQEKKKRIINVREIRELAELAKENFDEAVKDHGCFSSTISHVVFYGRTKEDYRDSAAYKYGVAFRYGYTPAAYHYAQMIEKYLNHFPRKIQNQLLSDQLLPEGARKEYDPMYVAIYSYKQAALPGIFLDNPDTSAAQEKLAWFYFHDTKYRELYDDSALDIVINLKICLKDIAKLYQVETHGIGSFEKLEAALINKKGKDIFLNYLLLCYYFNYIKINFDSVQKYADKIQVLLKSKSDNYPQREALLRLISLVYLKQGEASLKTNTTLARKYFEKALEVNPESLDACDALIRYYKAKHDGVHKDKYHYERLIPHLRDKFKLLPDLFEKGLFIQTLNDAEYDPKELKNLIEELVGQYLDEVITYYQDTVIDLKQAVTEVRQLMNSNYHVGINESLAKFLNILTNELAGKNKLNEANWYDREGKKLDAIGCYQESIKKGNVDGLLALADIYDHTIETDKDKAVDLYAQVLMHPKASNQAINRAKEALFNIALEMSADFPAERKIGEKAANVYCNHFSDEDAILQLIKMNYSTAMYIRAVFLIDTPEKPLSKILKFSNVFSYTMKHLEEAKFLLFRSLELGAEKLGIIIYLFKLYSRLNRSSQVEIENILITTPALHPLLREKKAMLLAINPELVAKLALLEKEDICSQICNVNKGVTGMTEPDEWTAIGGKPKSQGPRPPPQVYYPEEKRDGSENLYPSLDSQL